MHYQAPAHPEARFHIPYQIVIINRFFPIINALSNTCSSRNQIPFSFAISINALSKKLIFLFSPCSFSYSPETLHPNARNSFSVFFTRLLQPYLYFMQKVQWRASLSSTKMRFLICFEYWNKISLSGQPMRPIRISKPPVNDMVNYFFIPLKLLWSYLISVTIVVRSEDKEEAETVNFICVSVLLVFFFFFFLRFYIRYLHSFLWYYT